MATTSPARGFLSIPWSTCSATAARPAEIQQGYRALSLPQIYRAIAFYLENRELVDRSLEEADELMKANSIPLSEANPEMWDRLQQARQELRARE